MKRELRTAVVMMSILFSIVPSGRATEVSLTVEIESLTFSEDVGSVNAKINRQVSETSQLVVKITSSDITELWIPSTVVIPANESEAEFTIEIVNDGLLDGTQTVELTASASGYPNSLTEIQVLDDDTPDNRTFGGHLYGTIERHTYTVIADIIVPVGHTLEIQPGSVLRFNPEIELKVEGTIQAVGNPGNEIVFTSASEQPQRGDWSGISAYGNGGQDSLLDYVEVAFATRGVYIYPSNSNPKMIVKNSKVHDCSSRGISVGANYRYSISADDIRLIYNRVYNNGSNGIYISSYADGCNSSWNSCYVGYNEIYGNEGDGINLYAGNSSRYCDPFRRSSRVSSEIVGNYIHDNNIGISSGTSDSPNSMSIRPKIINNLLSYNATGGLSLLTSDEYLNAVVVNNTIVNNGGAGILHESLYSLVVILNNIVVNNETGIESRDLYDPNVCEDCEIRHNNVFNNSGGNWINYPSEFGLLTEVNAKGTPADTAMNISIDPLFAGPVDYHIQSTSPARDAGVFKGDIVPTEDFDGDLRTPPIDIGFDEFKYISVTSPKGRSWLWGDILPIRWRSVNKTGNVRIELYKGGSLDHVLEESIADKGKYDWLIPDDDSLIGGGDYQVRVVSVSDPCCYGKSDFGIGVPWVHILPDVTPVKIEWDAIFKPELYYVECSSDPCFSVIDCNSGWIMDTSHEFSSLNTCGLLLHSRLYWYRVKAMPIHNWQQTTKIEFDAGVLTETRATNNGDVVLLGDLKRIADPSFETQTGWMIEKTDSSAVMVRNGRGDWKSDGLSSFGIYFIPGTKIGDYGCYRQAVDLSLVNWLLFDYCTIGGENIKAKILIGNVGIWDVNGVGDGKDPHYNIHLDVSDFSGSKNIEFRADSNSTNMSALVFDHLRTFSSPYVGSIVSPVIDLPVDANWVIVRFNSIKPAGTNLSVDVLPKTGSTPIPGYEDIRSGMDLTSINEASIRLKVILTSSDPDATPVLHDWSVSWARFVEESNWSNVESSKQATQIIPSNFMADCNVDWLDFEVMAEQWLSPPGIPSADISPWPNGDGIVNMKDFSLFAECWLYDANCVDPNNR